MNETQLAEYLKRHLKVKIDNVWLEHDYSLRVSLLLDNAVISKDEINYCGV